MSQVATSALLKAIEGFSGATAGQKQHESTNELLARVRGEIGKGKGAAPDSPGRREALGAAQRNHPSEAAHSAGDGQVRSVAPDSGPHEPDEAPHVWDGHPGTHEKLSATEAVRSAGNTRSALPSGGYPAGIADLRRIAADKEAARPDSKLSKVDGRQEGNRESVAPAPPAPASGRIGQVEKASVPTDRGMQANRMAEGKVPVAQEPLAKNVPGFRGAEEAARKKLAGMMR